MKVIKKNYKYTIKRIDFLKIITYILFFRVPTLGEYHSYHYLKNTDDFWMRLLYIPTLNSKETFLILIFLVMAPLRPCPIAVTASANLVLFQHKVFAMAEPAEMILIIRTLQSTTTIHVLE